MAKLDLNPGETMIGSGQMSLYQKQGLTTMTLIRSMCWICTGMGRSTGWWILDCGWQWCWRSIWLWRQQRPISNVEKR